MLMKHPEDETSDPEPPLISPVMLDDSPSAASKAGSYRHVIETYKSVPLRHFAHCMIAWLSGYLTSVHTGTHEADESLRSAHDDMEEIVDLPQVTTETPYSNRIEHRYDYSPRRSLRTCEVKHRLGFLEMVKRRGEHDHVPSTRVVAQEVRQLRGNALRNISLGLRLFTKDREHLRRDVHSHGVQTQ